MVRDCRWRQSSAQREATGELRPAFDGIAQMHYAARAALYGEFVQAGGLCLPRGFVPATKKTSRH
jgi:hypothetical protein